MFILTLIRNIVNSSQSGRGLDLRCCGITHFSCRFFFFYGVTITHLCCFNFFVQRTLPDPKFGQFWGKKSRMCQELRVLNRGYELQKRLLKSPYSDRGTDTIRPRLSAVHRLYSQFMQYCRMDSQFMCPVVCVNHAWV